MRLAWSILPALAMLLLASGARALEPKAGEVVLTGRITCAKCDLKLAPRCATVIVVPNQGQQYIYYFDANAHRKYHRDTCGGESRQGVVTGKVFEYQGMPYIAVSQLQYLD